MFYFADSFADSFNFIMLDFATAIYFCIISETEELDLRFSEIVIPPEETTYYCTYVSQKENTLVV